MSSPALRIVVALFALFFLVGARCVFIATSGSQDDEEQEEGSGLVVLVGEGRLVDGPVEGVGYASGSLSGVTGSDGEFQYEEGSTIRFSIGDILLGQEVKARNLMTPLDLVPGASLDSPAVINIARLLQSLDAVRGDGKITIPDAVRNAAVTTNEALGFAIQSLDYADNPTFVNAASQLVATLTQAYGFTAVLVDADTARRHLLESLASPGSL